MKYGIFIGRFSPFHKGHEVILNKALEMSDKVIVVIGSSNAPSTIKNPWSALEREELIKGSINKQKEKLIFIHQKDFLYKDDSWVNSLEGQIKEIVKESNEVTLFGYHSDESSYYLKLFPNYKFISCPTEYNFHASEIRKMYFTHDSLYSSMVPNYVSSYLESFKNTDSFSNLKNEYEYIQDYKEQWRGAPYAPIFMTVDTMVVKNNHLLVVKRKENPGKGLYALPGGFVNQEERLLSAAIRELKEETCIDVSEDVLTSCIVNQQVFDDPGRSLRGRTITNCYYIDLGDGLLPSVKGSDDAEQAFWLPLEDFNSMMHLFFEDHWHIVNFFKTFIYKSYSFGNLHYYKDKKCTILHREDGPAIEMDSGNKQWYLNNNLHREDGPAIEDANGHKEWWFNDELHREDGPAIEHPNGTKEWWLNGEHYKNIKNNKEWLVFIKTLFLQ